MRATWPMCGEGRIGAMCGIMAWLWVSCSTTATQDVGEKELDEHTARQYVMQLWRSECLQPCDEAQLEAKVRIWRVDWPWNEAAELFAVMSLYLKGDPIEV